MNIQIKNRWTGSVIFECEALNIKLAVKAALEKGVSLFAANLTKIRDDFWAVLSSAPAEIPGLRAAIIEGRINGSTYEGECSCLVGTIAKVRGCNYAELKLLKPDSDRPAERFFMGISKGDKPETNSRSKLVLEWLDQWIQNVGAAFSAK